MLEYAFEPDRIRERASTWLDLCSSASRDDKLRREAIRVQDVWRAPLEKAIADGQVSGEFEPRVRPAVAVDLLLAVVDGTELAATIDDARVPADQMLAATITVARDLLGVRDSPRLSQCLSSISVVHPTGWNAAPSRERPTTMLPLPISSLGR
jgi:hypothetical protein